MFLRPASRKTFQTWLAAAAITLLSACSSIKVSEPPDLVTTTTTKVVVTGNDRYTGLRVSLDGNDVSSQMVYQGAGSNRDEGTFSSLTAGMHTVVASADVPCWYCTGQKTRSTDTKAFCISAAATKITFAQSDNSSWASSGGATLSQASDSGKCITRWRFIPSAPGIGTTVGRIESAEFPSRCLTSPDDNAGSVIAFATCDPANLRQRWFGSRQQLSGGKGFYVFENQAPTNTFRCLTQTSGGGAVTQTTCRNATNQLWAVRNNTTGLFETEVHPLGAVTSTPRAYSVTNAVRFDECACALTA